MTTSATLIASLRKQQTKIFDAEITEESLKQLTGIAEKYLKYGFKHNATSLLKRIKSYKEKLS